jgi:acyl-CoA thioester hydrolase
MENVAAPVAIELRVRYAETDQMGVVYHANYLPWCEIARTELIRRRWRSYADLESEGIRLAVSEATLRYHAPARYDDLIRVECRTETVRSRAVSFSYLVSRIVEGMEPVRLVSARTDLVAIDHSGRPRQLPADLVARLRGE